MSQFQVVFLLNPCVLLLTKRCSYGYELLEYSLIPCVVTALAPLAAYLGCSSLEPGEVINFTKDQLEGLLTTHDLDLEKAMYRQSHTVQ